jgi:hypothetical protein
MLDDILFAILGGAAADVGRTAVWKKRARASRGEGRALVAMRVRGGAAPGLADRWREAEVRPSSGVLAYELRVLRVADVVRRTDPLRLRETWRIPLPTSDLVLFEMRIAGSTLDLAAWDQDADWLETQLAHRQV